MSDAPIPSPEELAAFRGMLDGTVALPQSMWHHVRTRQLELSGELSGRVPIYLDTRFWIDLRRADEGDARCARLQPLLAALRAKAAQGKIFCPISSSTFVEVLKHGSPEVRLRTARLVDELSLGVSLLMLEELADAELEWLATRPGDHPIDPLVVPVWTRLSYSLGTAVPQWEGMDYRTQLAIQVAGFDTVWRVKLEEVLLEATEIPTFNLSEAAERMTAGNRAHADQVTDFATVFRSEAHGVGEHFGPRFVKIIRRLALESGYRDEPIDPQLCINAVGNLLALCKVQQALRSLHIRASLHAIIRLNKGRAFKANDFTDLEHAVAGVGYSRAFFTERSLATAVTQKPLELDQLFGCFVTSDPEQAVRFVTEI